MDEKKMTDITNAEKGVDEVNVENVMRGAEILRNKYEMLYEDLPETDAMIHENEITDEEK